MNRDRSTPPGSRTGPQLPALALFNARAWAEHHGAVRTGKVQELSFARCPWCAKDYHLQLNIEKLVFRCYRCDKAGSVLTLVMTLEGVDLYGAQDVLASWSVTGGGIQQVSLHFQDQNLPSTEGGSGWKPRSWPPGTSFPLAGRFLDYMRGRGASDEDIVALQLCSVASGRYRERVIFPVYGPAGELLYYQGRDITGQSDRKTLNPPSLEGYAGAGDVVLNVYQAVREGRGRVVLVEGPVDVAVAGVTAVSCLGSKVSDVQIDVMRRAGVAEVDLAWDCDAVGLAKAAAVLPRLASLFTVRWVALPPGEDPASIGRPHFDYLRGQAGIWDPVSSLYRI